MILIFNNGTHCCTRTMPFTRRKMFCENSSNRLYGPQQSRLETGLRYIWGAMQPNMHRTPISSLDDLKDRVRTCWENLDQQIIDKSIDHWSWQTEGCGLTELWSHWTVVLTIWFICCRALLCSVCVLITFMRFAIVYRASRWYCDKKSKSSNELIDISR